MNRIVSIILVLLLPMISIAAENAPEAVNPEGVQSARNYPGGIDEEDLKIQTELPAAAVTVDRRTVEQRVLKNFLKKSSDSEQPSSETGTSN